MRTSAFGLTMAASIVVFSMEAAAALCDSPRIWPGGQSADVVFTGVDAIEDGARGDGPNEPMPVSLNGDVLGLGEELTMSAGGLVASGPVVCVRHRPEWLGITVANTGAEAAAGVLRISSTQGVKLEAELPVILPGEERRMLVMGGEHISAIAADALELIRR